MSSSYCDTTKSGHNSHSGHHKFTTLVLSKVFDQGDLLLIPSLGRFVSILNNATLYINGSAVVTEQKLSEIVQALEVRMADLDARLQALGGN